VLEQKALGRTSMKTQREKGVRQREDWIARENLSTVERMATCIAHEVNNLLSVIKTTLLMIRSLLPEGHPDVRYIDRSEHDIDYIVRILRQLLSFHQSGLATTIPCVVDEIVRDTAALVTTGNRDREIAIDLKLPAARVLAPFPERLVRQLIFNIVSGTAVAAQPGSLITLALTAHAERINIDVSAQMEGQREKGTTKSAKMRRRASHVPLPRSLKARLSIPAALLKQLGGSLVFYEEAGQGVFYSISLPSQVD
jgi:C4-dicarboxylate-specific signal transduction histidine kinase